MKQKYRLKLRQQYDSGIRRMVTEAWLIDREANVPLELGTTVLHPGEINDPQLAGDIAAGRLFRRLLKAGRVAFPEDDEITRLMQEIERPRQLPKSQGIASLPAGGYQAVGTLQSRPLSPQERAGVGLALETHKTVPDLTAGLEAVLPGFQVKVIDIDQPVFHRDDVGRTQPGRVVSFKRDEGKVVVEYNGQEFEVVPELITQ